MPQTFQVLRCYKCSVFQVHQTKKSNKWQCKLCGEKQSIKRHYGLGTAKDCRLHVQKLNGIRGELDELAENIQNDTDEEVEHSKPTSEKQPKKSKWLDYVDETENDENKSDDGMYLDNTEVVFEIPKKKRKNFKVPKKDIGSGETVFQAPRESYSCEDILHNLNKKTVEPEQECYAAAKYSKTLNTALEVAINNKVSLVEKTDISQCETTIDIDIQEKKTSAPFVAPKLNKNSKWAQYIDTEENNEEFVSESLQDTFNANHNLKSLFSLCNDEDIDDVLDI